MTVPVIYADDYVDVDEMVSKYHRRKSTLLFLIAAITLIFTGTFGGYSMLQYSTAKNESYETTVAEFAEVTVESPQCQANPNESVCVKARDVLHERSQTGNGSYPLDYTMAHADNLGPLLVRAP